MSRKDGRTSQQLRQMSIEHSTLNKADGSARFSSGNTVVLCSVVGPAEVKPRNELMDRASVEVVFKPATGLSTTKEKLLEHFLAQTLSSVILATLHPRSAITIVVQVVNDDGAILSASVNAACLALIDAGISLSSFVVASTCCLLPSAPEELVVDPTLEEQQQALSTFTLCFDGSLKELVMSESHGDFTQAMFLQAMTLSRASAGKVVELFRQSLERKLKKEKELREAKK